MSSVPQIVAVVDELERHDLDPGRHARRCRSPSRDAAIVPATWVPWPVLAGIVDACCRRCRSPSRGRRRRSRCRRRRCRSLPRAGLARVRPGPVGEVGVAEVDPVIDDGDDDVGIAALEAQRLEPIDVDVGGPGQSSDAVERLARCCARPHSSPKSGSSVMSSPARGGGCRRDGDDLRVRCQLAPGGRRRAALGDDDLGAAVRARCETTVSPCSLATARSLGARSCRRGSGRGPRRRAAGLGRSDAGGAAATSASDERGDAPATRSAAGRATARRERGFSIGRHPTPRPFEAVTT